MDFLIHGVICLLFTLPLIHTLIFIARRSRTSPGKLPPGPVPLPIIGNLLALGNKPHISLAKLAKIYGPLMTLRLGHLTTIVISSSSLAKEVLQKHDLIFSSRTILDATKAHKHHEASMVWLPVAEPWRNLRKICNTYIFTNQKLDANRELRQKKIQELVADVQESCHAGTAVDIAGAASKTSLGALSNTVLSLDLSDSSLDIAREFKELVCGVMDELGKPNLADYFPLLSKIDPQGISRRTAIYFQKMLDIFERIINERLQLRKAEDYIPSNDMLDTLLNITGNNSNEMDINQIQHLFLDLFLGGTHTTSTALEWAMAELLRNPSTLMQARKELEETIGRGKLLEESDITRLPYLQAIMKETLRLHQPPLLLPHKAGEEVEMLGFRIPKGSQVLVNAWAICRDPSTWENPNSFVPERFLGSDIDVRGRNFELIPFGAGRRICPGLSLAMRMLPLMLGSLIHSFDWKLEDGVTPESMDMEEKFGATFHKAQPLLAVPIQV